MMASESSQGCPKTAPRGVQEAPTPRGPNDASKRLPGDSRRGPPVCMGLKYKGTEPLIRW
eukprot:6388606-Pyramimonas_sp.AAC.1